MLLKKILCLYLCCLKELIQLCEYQECLQQAGIVGDLKGCEIVLYWKKGGEHGRLSGTVIGATTGRGIVNPNSSETELQLIVEGIKEIWGLPLQYVAFANGRWTAVVTISAQQIPQNEGEGAEEYIERVLTERFVPIIVKIR